MEAGDRIDRRPLGASPSGNNAAAAASSGRRSASALARILGARPDRRAPASAAAAASSRNSDSLPPPARAQPGREARHRREGDEGLQVRQLRFSSSTTCLIRKLPKETPAQAALAVGDRVEDRGRRSSAGIGDALRGEQRRDGVRDLLGQRHLDEDQRLVDELRVEEGEAAPVRAARAGGADRPSRGSRARPRSG